MRAAIQEKMVVYVDFESRQEEGVHIPISCYLERSFGFFFLK
jgi:hypothetical protein